MKLKVDNFQSIKSAEIEVKGLTVITGENSIGKSALARAFNGVFTNLRGDAHVRNGESHSSVLVTFDDGNEVLWEKGKKVNRYVVNGKEISKVGSGVPDEVKDLGIKSVTIDGKEVYPQIAKQFQNIFLIDLPPSALSSALSDVEMIQQLETASAKARSEIRDIKSRMKVKREDLETAKNNLALYEDLDMNVLSDFEQAEQSQIEAEGKVTKAESLALKKDKISKLIEIMAEAKDVETPSFDLSEYDQISELENLLKRRNQVVNQIEALEEIETSPINVSAPTLPEVDELQRLLDRRNKIGSAIKELMPLLTMKKIVAPTDDSEIITMLERKQKLELGIQLASNEIDKLSVEVEEVQKEIRKGVCPICLREGGDSCHD